MYFAYTIKKLIFIDRGDYHQQFALVGNGWCQGVNAARIQKASGSFDWQNAVIGTDKSAEACEISCMNQTDCIGYITEDSDKCDTILSSDKNAAEGISRVDQEKRNHCWLKFNPGN